ncbi:MAG TPA: UPF0182 family protein [Thermodesulfovibrionales bacterium]|nr:UPF0182 family protein [Thermodesulfovibrionales bacterium]
MPGRLPKKIVPVSLAVVLGLFFLPQFISLYVDWLWFNDVNFAKIFTVRLNAQVMSALAGGLAGFVISYVSIWFSLQATKGRPVVMTFGNQAMPQLNVLRYFDRLKIIIPILIGWVTGLSLKNNWLSFLYYFNRVDSGYSDPIFGKDVSFYLFTLPAYEIISSLLMFILVASLALSVLTYILKGAVFMTQRGIISERSASAHLSVLGSLIFLVLAFKTYTGMYTILSSSHGHVAGATYTDVHAVIPFLKARIVIALAAAVLLISNIFLRRTLIFIGTAVLYLAVSFIGSSVYPAIIQKFVVAPNELVKETPYITHNIASTRKGFGLDRVEERDISGSTTITRDDITKNSPTIKNIRLWDHRPLLDTFSQIQEIRTYYDFTMVGNDRYVINGEYRQTMLSPRELSTESIPTRNWINETLSFTHGYGLTLGPVNQVTPEGLPVLLIKDIPPVSTVADIKVTRPQIYYGKLSSNYVIVNTKSKEFDYPSGEANVFTEYSGKSGVVIDSFFKKFAFSVHFASMKLFLSNDITGKSRILFNRNILERVSKVMPFLKFDHDPYMVVSDDGQLYWIYDAYAVSGRFPYSQLVGNGINYIRNSVKVTINAYDGSMKFYIADKDDPIIRTIHRMFPGTLQPVSEMPADLKKHIRYPLDIFGIQTMVYSTYHMDVPQIFYNKEDQWEIPAMGKSEELMEPYYTIMKLPGEKKEEFILMLPFTPKKKDNLSAWMVARSDGEHYGKLVVYRFPKDRLVYGPKQIVARINQDTEISRQVSLWDQRGSQVIQGTLLVIPIENSLIYVQPLYLRADKGKIPELKRVVIAYENRIAMEETLDAALSKIFGDVRVSEEAAPSKSLRLPAVKEEKGLASGAREHFDRAMNAQREGNWALYGEEIKKLGEIIRKLQK